MRAGIYFIRVVESNGITTQFPRRIKKPEGSNVKSTQNLSNTCWLVTVGGCRGEGGMDHHHLQKRLGAGRNKDTMRSHLPFASEAVLQALGCSVASVVQAAGPPGLHRWDKKAGKLIVKVQPAANWPCQEGDLQVLQGPQERHPVPPSSGPSWEQVDQQERKSAYICSMFWAAGSPARGGVTPGPPGIPPAPPIIWPILS